MSFTCTGRRHNRAQGWILNFARQALYGKHKPVACEGVDAVQSTDFTRAAADSGIGSYLAKDRVNEAAPCDSERRSIA